MNAISIIDRLRIETVNDPIKVVNGGGRVNSLGWLILFHATMHVLEESEKLHNHHKCMGKPTLALMYPGLPNKCKRIK